MSAIDMRDIAAVAVACLTEPGHEGKKYAITGDKAFSNGEIAEKLTKVLGRTITLTTT